MQDHYIQTSAELHTLAIATSADNELLTSVVTKEVALGYIAGYFRMRRTLGMFERMAPAREGGAGGGAREHSECWEQRSGKTVRP